MEDDEVDEREFDAKTVYLLMTQDYRISRNIRASWFFQHINSTIGFTPKQSVECSKEELIVVSVEPEEYVDFKDETSYKIRIGPDTTVIFLARRYRLVFVLDLSPSIASVDICLGEVVYSEAYQTLARCLQGLVQPVMVPGSRFVYCPEIFITIIAHSPVLQGIINQVLAQGILVNKQNIESFLARMKKQLEDLEHLLAQGFSKMLDIADKINGHFDYSDDSIEPHHTAKPSDLMNKPEAGIVSLLRNGILALQLLPENSSADILVVTDGMVGVPDAGIFESLLNQLRSATIACSFLKIGKDYSSTHQLGHIPHSELLQFVSAATLGAYFESCPDMTSGASEETNPYHEAILMWSFQKETDSFQMDFFLSRPEDMPLTAALFQSQLLAHPIKDRTSSVMPTVRKKHLDTKLNTNLASVLSVRLREGYIIKHVAITKGGSQIEVNMVLPWREYVRIEYQAVSPWPLDSNKRHTHVEVIIEGSYDFLHDITCTQLKTARSHFRMANVKKFWLTLQGLSQTDQLLVHLQSFATNPVYYKLTESVKSGVPLFYLPQNSNTPVLNTQYNTKDPALNQFASFWKPVVNLDIKVWQKWMHAHRIGFVLEHDAPLPKYIHTPNSSGRFSSIQCRQAMTSLSLLLRDYSTFVLLENHSYIKLLVSDLDKPPASFFLLRVTSKPPCIVLRLAFLGGTRGSERHRIVQHLRDKVLALKFPKRGMQKVDRKKVIRSQSHTEPPKKPIHKPPLLRDWSEISCCVQLFKPVEHILIRYERKPKDMSVVEDPSKYIPSHIASQSYAANKSAANLFNMLSRYLHHQRWIWTVQQASIPISMSAVSRILSTLAKIRLQEGFHFAVTNSGISNMVLEVEMMDDMTVFGSGTVIDNDAARAVVQYILFPPHIKTTRDSVSEEDLDELETTEADGELQIVTECWVEPQHGLSINNTPERKKFDGLTYEEISRAFYAVDLECISCLVTFEHLVYLCQNSAIPVPLEIQKASEDRYIRGSCTQIGEGQPNIHHTQFPFDLLSLIPRSQQAELLFSTYILERSQKVPGDGAHGANCVLFSLLLDRLKFTHEREITLSTYDSQRFIKLLHERKRDGDKNPFPFPYGKPRTTTPGEEVDVDVEDVGHGNIPKTGKIDKFDEDKKKSPLPLKTGSTGDKNATINVEHDTPPAEKVPSWSCYIKMVSPVRMLWSLIPASFQDLLILQQHDPSSPMETSEQNIPLPSYDGLKSDVPVVSVDAEGSVNKNENAEPENFLHNEAAGSPNSENIQQMFTAEELPPKKTLTIPLYIFECSLHSITDSLVNPWGFQMPADVFEDMTFELTSDIIEEDNMDLSQRFRFPSLEREECTKEEMDSAPQAMRSSLERRSTEGSSDGGIDFQHHCTELTESYYSSFVRGAFQSLQQGLVVDRHDIESSVNNICEESLPLEVDVTTFLMASCRHLQQVVTKVTEQEEVSLPDNPVLDNLPTELTRPSSVRFAPDVDELEEYSSLKKIVPSVLKFPRSSSKMALPLSNIDITCEYLTGLHQLIQDKFCDIVQKWFQVVPASPDFYFYCPESVPQDMSLEEAEREADTIIFSGGHSDTLPVFDSGQDGIQRQTDQAECDKFPFPGAKPSGSDSTSTVSNLDSEESFSDSDDFPLQDNERKELSPLFVYFTCTVKSGLEHHNICIKKLMPCLAEITKSLGNVNDIDLSDLKITLDLNCMTLPSDNELQSPRRPSFLRMLSNASSTGSPPPSADQDQEEDKRCISPQKVYFGDPISHLPSLQHSAVFQCIEEINWLLRDEITSALRSIQPINADALQMVTDHIQFSAGLGKPTCCADEVPLQFVYGPDNSLMKFAEDFERMNLPGYHLVKEGNFYYIVVDRAHAHTLAHARALNYALVELSRDTSPVKRIHCLPSSVAHRERAATIATNNPSTTYADHSLGKDHDFPTNRKGSAEIPVKSQNGSRKPSSSDSKSGKGSREHSFDSGKKVDLVKLHDTNKNPMDLPVEVQINVTKERDMTLQSSFSERHLSSISKRVSSFDSSEFLEGNLKKSSSFAGFHTAESGTLCKPTERNTAGLSVSPVKLPFLGRYRHFSAPSGHGTPMSKPSTLPQTPSWFSSRGSYTEEGYDGDSSDSDDNATAGSSLSGKQRLLPNFWLIMKLSVNGVNIYFHTRETGQEENEAKLDQRNLLLQVKGNIEQICQKVNQKLLLHDLYATRMCNALLVSKADEEETWNIDKKTLPGTVDLSDEDDSDDHVEKKYLAAAMNFHPGYFDCQCILRMQFSLHPRLKMGPGRSGISRGLHALKTVLNQFSVNNRKNMYVIRETSGDHAVFYLRLRESVGLSRQVSAISGDEINASDLNSSYMLSAARRDEDQSKSSDRDTDSISITSAGSSFTRGIQDNTELQVYGIQPAGSEIKEDLRRILQNKLDDTVLDIISVMLSRNPMCKLMPEDVQFIQQPRQEPKDIMCLTIPGFTQMKLPALMFYLRQNLLQFMHVPNYVDSKPENHFQDIFNDRWENIPDSQVFLYIKPQASGGKGISSISMSLVDGQKNLVRMLSCPKPSTTGCSQIHDKSEFDNLVYTSVYSPSSKFKPGPTSLIQFRIWERGTGDLKRLREKLMSAVKHALCDIVMEYSLMTAPMCQVPHDLCDFSVIPTHSAPSSPSSPREMQMRERRHSTVTRKLSDDVKIASTASSARHMTFSPSPFQSLKEAFTPTKARYASPPPDMGKSFDLSLSGAQSGGGTTVPHEVNTQHVTENMQRHLVSKYEGGERGNLHPVFMNLMMDWLDYCCSLNVPSVQRTELNIMSSFSLDYILHELNALVNSIISDVQPKFFHIQYEDLTGGLVGVPYVPLRKSHQSGESRSSHSVDREIIQKNTVEQDASCVIIGRNLDQWQASVQRDIDENGIEMHTTAGTKSTPQQTFQRFQPYFCLPSIEKSFELIGFVSRVDPLFIPRQRLLFAVVKNKKISLYTYNWAGDMNTMLSKLVTQLIHWNNARSHLFDGVICQKMGLFHHRTFYETPMGQENNQYIMPSTDMDHLIKYSSPPVREQPRRHNSIPTSSHAPMRPFDVVFKNLCPPKSLHHSQHRNIRDPVAKHGLQAQEIRSHYKKDMDKILKLHKLYWMWFQKTSPNLPISEEIIQLLKQSSRLLHYSTTPILFCSSWRQKVIEKYNVQYQRDSTTPSPAVSEKAENKSRSRHSSGTSVTSLRSKRADSQEGKKRPSLLAFESIDSTQSLKLPSEESWHIGLRTNFICQYIKYLRSLGFVRIQTRPASPKRGCLRSVRKSSDGKHLGEDDSQCIATSTVYNLQKTLSGGIMLLELGFRKEYFCVKLYTCEFSRLGITVNQQIKLLFVDESEKCKTLVHVHSFAHDFHLRCIQSFLSGQQDLFKQGYHLTGFLADFLHVYPYPPSFSRNYLYEDTITIPNLTCPGHQLYDYMLKHVKQHNMRFIRMVPSPDADVDSDYYCVKWNEYALVQHKVHPGTPKEEDPTKMKNDDCDVGLVIVQETISDADRNSLQLHFFIVVTSRRELFPKMTLEKKLGEFKSSGTKEMSAESNRPVPVKQHIGVRQESLKYMSKPITHQAPILVLLHEEAEHARRKIQDMVEISTAKCRRDLLWQRMLVGYQTEEDGKKKKRTDTEESRDGDLSKLSFDEFQELLRKVTKLPLQDIDPSFVPFLNLNLQWYQGLFRILQAKYKEQHRIFTSPDGQMQYILILNPNWLDMFMMLTLDQHHSGRADICAMFREQPVDQEHTPENPCLSTLSMQSHIEGFINTCCFHLWAAML